MNSESIMHSDVLDIVFEKRNKLYGAYTLRKFYNHRLIKSLGITIGAVTFLSAFTFIPARKVIVIPVGDYVMRRLPKPTIADAKKEILKTAKAQKALQSKLTTPLIVDSKSRADTLFEIKPTQVTGSINMVGGKDEDPGIIGIPAGVETGGGQVPASTNVLVDKSKPMDDPEIEPEYPGGIQALRKFLERNLINPAEMEEGEMVSVHIKFVVGFDGKLQQFKVVKDGGEIFNKEVIRVLKKMPEWIPGKSRGENVSVNFTIPIKFVPVE